MNILSKLKSLVLLKACQSRKRYHYHDPLGLYPTCRQFHQRETRAFFVGTAFWQLFSSYMYVVKAAETYICVKNLYVYIYEIDGWSFFCQTLCKT
jgi:hypothetical protein